MTTSNSHKNQDIVGADVVPTLPKINSLQAIMRLRPKAGCEWSTFAFSLNRDIVKPNGEIDDLYAVVFPLGSFYDRDAAEEHAKNVIETTGHPGIITARYGTPVKLTTKFDPNLVVDVPVDIKGRIIQLESSQYKRDKEEFEKRAKIEREILKEAEEETDVNSIEHFKRQCYLALKNRSNYEMHNKEASEAWANYKKRESLVRDHFKRHPEHEQNWLDHLKEKLTERGEHNLYEAMKHSYGEIREELLGLKQSDNKSREELKEELRKELREELKEELKEELEKTPKHQKDCIECECGETCDGLINCDDGVCLVDNTSQKSSDCDGGVCMVVNSDDCDGGICMVDNTARKLEIVDAPIFSEQKSNENNDAMTNEQNSEIIESSNQDDSKSVQARGKGKKKKGSN